MSFVHPIRTPLRPKHSRNMSSIHSRPGTPGSLPVIAEDGDTFFAPSPPPIPPKALNRPSSNSPVLSLPPDHNHEKSPPAYSPRKFKFIGVIGPNGEKLSDLRRSMKGDIQNNKFVAKRGGWKTLAIIAVLMICAIVGLVVGLVVGLRKRCVLVFCVRILTDILYRNSNNSTNSSMSSTANVTFPEGSYRFDTVLSSVATNCTSNSATWMCYPYTTYSQNPSASAATFDWVISPSTGNTPYIISSTPNYFSILFSNATLSLRNPNQADEYYYFSTTLQKPTKPAAQLGSENVASTCYFNQTVFEGYLYTKMNAALGGSISSANGTGVGAYKPWPYAVRVKQTSAAGSDTPTCLGPDGQVLGDFSVADASQECGCTYANAGL